MSIKDRIASIETGEWRFSSEDEADEDKSQSEVSDSAFSKKIHKNKKICNFLSFLFSKILFFFFLGKS